MRWIHTRNGRTAYLRVKTLHELAEPFGWPVRGRSDRLVRLVRRMRGVCAGHPGRLVGDRSEPPATEPNQGWSVPAGGRRRLAQVESRPSDRLAHRERPSAAGRLVRQHADTGRPVWSRFKAQSAEEIVLWSAGARAGHGGRWSACYDELRSSAWYVERRSSAWGSSIGVGRLGVRRSAVVGLAR